MEDVKALFAAKIGEKLILHLLGEREWLEGKVEEASENYVSIVDDTGTKFCVLYQGIVSVELLSATDEISSFN